MATFPAITPNTRMFSLGNYPQSEYVGTSGGSVRFLHGDKRFGQMLTFIYTSLNESQLFLIYEHFNGQEEGLIPFDLPNAIWAGYSSIPVSALEYQWRYASSPSVQPEAIDRFSVTIDLESVVL